MWSTRWNNLLQKPPGQNNVRHWMLQARRTGPWSCGVWKASRAYLELRSGAAREFSLVNGWWMDGEWMANGWWVMANDLDKLCFVFERPHCGVSGKMVNYRSLSRRGALFSAFSVNLKKQPTPDRWWNMMNYWLVFVDDVLPLIKSLLANVVVLTRSSSWIYRDNTTDSHSGELVLQIPGNIRYMTWILL